MSFLKQITSLFFYILSSLVVNSQNLELYYPFNGNANDASSNGYNATVYGASLTADRLGTPNSAYFFNGLSDYIDSQASFDLPQRTVSIWIQPFNPSFQNISTVATQDDSQYNYGQIVIRCDESKWRLRAGGEQVKFETPALDTNWTHICLVRDSSISKYYINGVLLSTGVSGSVMSGSGSGYPYFLLGIGRRLNEQYFEGKIDDVRIYSSALTNEEIYNLYSYNSLISITDKINSTQSLSVVHSLENHLLKIEVKNHDFSSFRITNSM